MKSLKENVNGIALCLFELVTGISKIQLTVDMLRWKNKKWFWAAISSSLIVEGILDIVAMVAGKKTEGNLT